LFFLGGAKLFSAQGAFLLAVYNNTNITTTNRKKSAAAIAVNFKKLKKKGEERIREIKNALW